MHGPRQPVHLVTGLEADRESLSCRLCGPARRVHRGIELRQRQAGMAEKGLACGGQLDAMHAARQEFCPDLVLQITNRPAQRGLGGMQPSLGSLRQAARLSDGYEIPKMSQLHGVPMLSR